ncbi:TatD family hydrolase [Aeoliella mucimassa]|uniref:Putative deoxyribonuclease YcfH n=1 Tax=Aeoliella mucimassa TaxID=2527972 RepID=A0A518ARY4_9BACT|nr:TatD family hydrolase [Aeoliella mucimassa]QDU57481.1 putative deoxyribonuclease YcfH [Aeoliella mucimassa]
MYFDTHAHLDQDNFDDDRDEVVARAHQAGVTHILAMGVSAASSARCVELASQYSGMYAAVGIQPNYVHETDPGDWDRIVQLAQQPRVVALGETGLDRYWDDAPFDVQQDYFDRHLRHSQATGLPFIVHMRECEADVLEMLREAAARGPLAGVMHSYTGTAAGAAESIELGLYVSFAGMVTYKKSDELREVAATVPLDRMLIETDSPYLSPEPMRKIRRNEPAHVVHTCSCLAEVLGTTPMKVAEATTANAKRLFGIDKA